MGIRDIYSPEMDELKKLFNQLGIEDLGNLSDHFQRDAEQWGISDTEAQEALLQKAKTLRERLIWARERVQAILDEVRKADDSTDIRSQFATSLDARRKELSKEAAVENRWISLRNKAEEILSPSATLNDAIVVAAELAKSDPGFQLKLYPSAWARRDASEDGGVYLAQAGGGCDLLHLAAIERHTLVKKPYNYRDIIQDGKTHILSDQTHEGRVLGLPRWRVAHGQFQAAWLDITPIHGHLGYFMQLTAREAELK